MLSLTRVADIGTCRVGATRFCPFSWTSKSFARGACSYRGNTKVLKMENLERLTVAEIVAANWKTSDVFKKNGIDFCCGGKVKLPDICKKKGIRYDVMKEELSKVIQLAQEDDENANFNTMDLDALADHIVNTHHKYLEEAHNTILQYSDKVARVHGEGHPEVVQINRLFHTMVRELNSHVDREESVLFPYIRQMAQVKKGSECVSKTPCFRSIQQPIGMMRHEHDRAGDVIKEIAALSNNFTPPAGACNTFRVMYSMLNEYQDDLFKHVHLENNILFPKAIALEKEIPDPVKEEC